MTKKQLEELVEEQKLRIGMLKETNHKFQVETLQAKETARWAEDAIKSNDRYANQIDRLIELLHNETIGSE